MEGSILMVWLTPYTVLWFLVLLTVLVFVHELGHYLVARANGVKVEVFSIGFGPELFGWNDRTGTRWKFSAIPFGGYVKMFGDADPSSMPGEHVSEMTAAERAVSFHHKHLLRRIAIVAAGPFANFAFAIVVLSVLIAIRGEQYVPPEVGQVLPSSAAEAAGIKGGDVVVSIDGTTIDNFRQIQRIIELNTGTPIEMVVRRDGQEVDLHATPRVTVETDRFGFTHQVARLGLQGGRAEFMHRSPAEAVGSAMRETWTTSVDTLKAVGQMISGVRGTDDLRGTLGILQYTGAVAQDGFMTLLGFAAGLSINLGLVNLFPIPVLDGGHLLFYAAEAIRGKPLSQRAQEYGFRVGLALVLTLIVFVTWKDVVRIWSSSKIS
jgi:regulator of sigma E protease